VQYVVVETNGSTQAIERARTTLEQAYPVLYSPATIAESQTLSFSAQRASQFRQLADVVILASLPIAGCSLAVSVIAGIGDRKRPFSLLRLTGAPLSLLRRVIAIESALPLLVTAVIAIGTAFLAAGLFLKSQLSENLRAPGSGYYVIVAAGLLVSLGIIATTFPLLARMTGPETARND
jgi:predicted lysophospholipase L1 biosynthesis ABC-type transport system permease subunit